MDNPGLAMLIESQSKTLKSLTIDTHHLINPVPSIEDALRMKVYSLTQLSLFHIFFSLDMFANCKNLQDLLLHDRRHLRKRFLEKFMTSSFPYLTNIDIRFNVPYLRHLSSLIENSGGLIHTIYLEWKEPKDPEFALCFATALANCCPNLEAYEGPFPNEGILQLPILFSNCPKLVELKILNYQNMFCDVSIVLRQMGDFVPLEFNSFIWPSNWACTTEALETFIRKCDTRLKEELFISISNRTYEHEMIIKHFVEEGILVAECI